MHFENQIRYQEKLLRALQNPNLLNDTQLSAMCIKEANNLVKESVYFGPYTFKELGARN